jgi:hypothetical protein
LAQTPFDDEEKPLDPAAERVRRKLVRFMAINLGLLFTAVIVVLAAIVYRSSTQGPATSGRLAEAEIALPAGARMIGHGYSDGRISLDVELADGSRAIFLYDTAAQKIVGRYTVTAK